MGMHRGMGILATAITFFAASASAADNGTALTATGAVASIACINDGEAIVTINAQLTTSGSVDSAEVTLSVDGGSEISVGTISPRDFVHDGRTKTAAFTDSVTLGNGTHTLQYCFTQSGSQGREPKQVCLTLTDIVVDCAPDEDRCGTPEVFFGNTPNNPVLLVCAGAGSPSIPVHVKSTSEEIRLDIAGPGDFTLSTTMDRSGESCVHQFRWATRGNNGGAGSYTFTATDAATGAVLATLTRDIACR